MSACPVLQAVIAQGERVEAFCEKPYVAQRWLEHLQLEVLSAWQGGWPWRDESFFPPCGEETSRSKGSLRLPASDYSDPTGNYRCRTHPSGDDGSGSNRPCLIRTADAAPSSSDRRRFARMSSWNKFDSLHSLNFKPWVGQTMHTWESFISLLLFQGGHKHLWETTQEHKIPGNKMSHPPNTSLKKNGREPKLSHLWRWRQ